MTNKTFTNADKVYASKNVDSLFYKDMFVPAGTIGTIVFTDFMNHPREYPYLVEFEHVESGLTAKFWAREDQIEHIAYPINRTSKSLPVGNSWEAF